jgi:hypothetical protein
MPNRFFNWKNASRGVAPTADAASIETPPQTLEERRQEMFGFSSPSPGASSASSSEEIDFAGEPSNKGRDAVLPNTAEATYIALGETPQSGGEQLYDAPTNVNYHDPAARLGYLFNTPLSPIASPVYETIKAFCEMTFSKDKMPEVVDTILENIIVEEQKGNSQTEELRVVIARACDKFFTEKDCAIDTLSLRELQKYLKHEAPGKNGDMIEKFTIKAFEGKDFCTSFSQTLDSPRSP